MREILYRGLNANGEFVYGLPYLDAPNSTAYYSDYSYRITWCPESGGHSNQPVKNGTLCQFTGLLDKNGVKVFEGDIVEILRIDIENEAAMEEYFNNDKEAPLKAIGKDIATMSRFPRFWLEKESFGYEGEELENPLDCIVIGNIHQNPELLK